MSDLRNAFYKREETKLKHTIRFHPSKTVCLMYFHLHRQTCYFCSLVYFVTLNHIILGQFLAFVLATSKFCPSVKLFSLIFIITGHLTGCGGADPHN